MSTSSAGQTVRALLLAQREAWMHGDADAVAAGFHADAVFVSPVATFVGQEAIRQAAADFFAYAARIEIEVRRLYTDGTHGVVEWAWAEEARHDRAIRTADDAIVFEVQDGLFLAWREYINWHDTPAAP